MNPSEVFHKIIPSPPKPNHLPANIHWLSGEGCGSWFHIEPLNNDYIISRYSPEGKLECKGMFEQMNGTKFEMTQVFEFTYLSHCAEVNIIQQTEKITFRLKYKI